MMASLFLDDAAAQAPLSDARRVVIKLGTQIVVEENGQLAQDRLHAIISQCITLHKAGKEVILVSSGAVGLGRQRLNLSGPLSLNEKQACAAVGQSLLMEAYRSLFAPEGIVAAQVLLTAMDFVNRKHYLTLRQTLETLLKLGAVPIINENDVTSTVELQEHGTRGFSDNDKLSALVAGKLDADLLVILTNVAGIYTENPAHNPLAKKIPLIQSWQDLQGIGTSGQSLLGRGGMASKLEAAKVASLSGLPTYIASGLQPEPLAPLLSFDATLTGTLVLPQAHLSGRKRWIGSASGYHGILVINDGAVQALQRQGASLLPVGIVAVEGDFSARQVLSIQNELGEEIGRGLSGYDAATMRTVQGLRGQDIAVFRSAHISREEAIHRDDLVLFDHPSPRPYAEDMI
jgi:glutamate 5-kinase